MEKPFNTEESYQQIDNLRKYSNRIGFSIFFFVFSSMGLVSLLAVPGPHFIDVNIDLLIGIFWAIIFIMCSIISLINSFNYRKKYNILTKKMLIVFPNAAVYIKYIKKTYIKNFSLNSVISLIIFTLSIIPLLTMYIGGDFSTKYQILFWISTIILFALALTIFFVSLIKFKLIRKLDFAVIEDKRKEDYFDEKNQKMKAIIGIVIYWIIAIALFIGFGLFTNAWYSAWIVLVICGVFFLLRTIIINPFHRFKKYESKKPIVKITKFLVLASLTAFIFLLLNLGSWYIESYIFVIDKVPTRELNINYNEIDGVYTIKNEKDTDFKILQLTDIHLGGSFVTKKKDQKALDTIYSLVTKSNPDLIIVTGDIVYPVAIQSFTFNNYIPMIQFCSFMNKLGIPWLLTYGNHDTEVFATYSFEAMEKMIKNYSFAYHEDNALLYNLVKPDVYGRNNQYIKILNSDNTINQLIFLIDSNSYISGITDNYDYIHVDQVAWYENIIKKETINEIPSSMLFFHIPIEEYQEAYDLYKFNNPEVTYYFGSNGESINTSKVSSNMFEKALELNSTKAIFVGHDHYNNISLGYQGIRLTYGMSIDYLASPGIEDKTAQRGGTLITLHENGEFDITQVQ